MVISQFRMAPNEALKCCLLFLSARRLCASQSLWVKQSFKHELQALGHEFNVNESAAYVK